MFQRNDLKDLWASGDGALPSWPSDPRPVSLIRPPRMFGVFAQKAQMYTGGMVRLEILMHLPWSQSSHEWLHAGVSKRNYT